MEKWFCIWQFSDNRKINLILEPKPAVVPERWGAVVPELRRRTESEKQAFIYPETYKAEA